MGSPSFLRLMPSRAAEISARRSVLYQSFKHSLPAAHMLGLSCALSSSRYFHFSPPLLSLSCGHLAHQDFVAVSSAAAWVSICYRGFLTLSPSFSHTHTPHSFLYLPDLISSERLSVQLMSATAHFSTDTAHPGSCLAHNTGSHYRPY